MLVAVARAANEERHEHGCLGLESAHLPLHFSSHVGWARGHDHDLLPALDVLDERPAPLPWEFVKPVVFQAERLACITASSKYCARARCAGGARLLVAFCLR